jgi:penicillin-insensitive murein endopeptidase
MPRIGLALSLVAFVMLAHPRGARASGDDDAPKRPTKRRAALMLQSGRDRVGSHAPTDAAEAAPKAPATSIGTPSAGRLEGGVHLDTSRPYVRVVSAYARGDVRWGLPVLTHALEHAARAVAKRYPGAVMAVGDLSRKHGGDLMRHHSHESGRDADVAFYIDDAKGRPINSSGAFVRFDAGLRATNGSGAHFDEAKNWLFVEKLLTEPGAHVSHIFISEPIRERLLAYARAHTTHAVWEKAAITLMQPTDSEPHDDHMHVRVSCPSGSLGACVEYAKSAIHHPKVIAARTSGHAVVLKTPARRAPAKAVQPKPQAPPAAAAAPMSAAVAPRAGATSAPPDALFDTPSAMAR